MPSEMECVGALQTPDIDEALRFAQGAISGGEHIICKRVQFYRPEDSVMIPAGYIEHYPVEYEVHVFRKVD